MSARPKFAPLASNTNTPSDENTRNDECNNLVSTSISEFPAELIAEVIAAAIDHPQPLDRAGRQFFATLRNVCRLWRQVAFNSPALWRGVHISLDTCTTETLDGWFARGGIDIPISLIVDGMYEASPFLPRTSTQASSSNTARLGKGTGTGMYRSSARTITGPFNFTPIVDQLTYNLAMTHAQRVEGLCAFIGQHRWNRLEVYGFDTAPVLSRILESNLRPSESLPSTPLFSTLSTLGIDWRGLFRLATPCITESNFPSLRVLHLAHWRQSTREPPSSPVLEDYLPVHHPHLHTLHLTNCLLASWALPTLLSDANLPALEEVHIVGCNRWPPRHPSPKLDYPSASGLDGEDSGGKPTNRSLRHVYLDRGASAWALEGLVLLDDSTVVFS